MNKKVIIYLGGILVLIIVVVGIILMVNAKNKKPTTDTTVTDQNTNTTDTNTDTTTNTNTNTDTTTTDTTTVQSRITKVSAEPVVSPVLSFDGKAVWYFTSAGSSYKVNLSTGLRQEYALQDKAATYEAIWPNSGADFILVSGNDPSRTFRYYNSDTKQFTEYPTNFKGVDFTSDTKSILYNWVKDNKSTLSTGNLRNSTFQNLIDLPESGLTVKAGPNINRALAFNKDKPDSGKLYLILIDTKKVITLKTGVDNSAIWSPDGKHFLYNRNPDETAVNKNLWLGDSTAPVDKDLGIVSTVSKAVFDSTGANLYVAVADTAGDGGDVIWKIDLSTLQKTQIFKPLSTDVPSTISVSQLLISPDNTSIFFKNSDGYLYGYKIGQ